jgi:mutator protein MutT
MEMDRNPMERITTAGVLFSSGRYFVAKRKMGGEIGGLWEFPGGKHRWGETPAQSLQREFMEEFAMEISVGPCFHVHDFIHRGTLYHLQAFWIYADEPMQWVLNEHQEVRWVSLQELQDLDFVPSDREVRQRVVELAFA